jgi:predicted RNase H-like HicB family nuclease
MKHFTAVIERDADTNLYVGWVPGFPGAHSQGETLDELRANLQEVVEMLLEEGEPQPERVFVGTQTVEVAWSMGKVPVLKPRGVSCGSGNIMKEPYLEVTFRHGRPIAAYYYLPRDTKQKSARTRRVEPGLVIDFTAEGQAIGIEITTPAKVSLAALVNCWSMDFADATLVALAEDLNSALVFTTDRTDFAVYRFKDRKPFLILPKSP